MSSAAAPRKDVTILKLSWPPAVLIDTCESTHSNLPKLHIRYSHVCVCVFEFQQGIYSASRAYTINLIFMKRASFLAPNDGFTVLSVTSFLDNIAIM